MWRALVLVIVAGFVDAAGFLALAGTFVAFMSGNTSAGGALHRDVRRRAGGPPALPAAPLRLSAFTSAP